jgi:hypothetical protein
MTPMGFAECHLEHEWVDCHGSFTVSDQPAGTRRGYPGFGLAVSIIVRLAL